MLLRSKKTHGEEQNWCAILSPLKNEFDKKKVAQKISEIFPLSSEEAMDMVSNTPIILLDNLSRPIASKVQDYFRGIGAEIVLTNDVLQKRKCYRTVWPETPSLAFLHQWQPAESHPGAQVLPASEALEALGSLEPPIPITSKSSGLKFSDFSDPDRDNFSEELERLRKESAALREQAQRFREELEEFKEQARSGRLPEIQILLDEKEKEAKELRMLLSHAEEKYQVLHGEYREARALYEEKITLLAREVERGKEHEKNASGYAQKIGAAMQEIESSKLKIKELNDKLLFLQRNKEQLETSVNEQAEKITLWSEKHRQMADHHEQIRKQKEEEAAAREDAEKRAKELSLKYQELAQELESRTAEIKRWELKSSEIEKQFQELHEAYQNQDQILQANLRQLEHREKELESARKQLREINSQIEQRETTQRRTRLAAELVEKENFLKKLVGEQEKMEFEIREREESIRKVLLEQEKVEKEIMEGKQAQRHLIELAKRDRTSRFKNGREGEETGLPAERGEHD